MKPIKIRPTVLDIPFVDSDGNEILRLQFDRSDGNVKNFYEIIPEIEKQIHAVEQYPEAEFDEGLFIKKLADSFLGEGAFDKLHALNDSTFTAAKYVMQIAIGIKEEMEEEDKRAVFDRYK